ncbi:hypothetical protein AB4559_23090 [Vibrio sp. 10N.222.51.C8]|jgi:hypothetical protein|nr:MULTISPECIES: hypothetical protein [Vibrio]ANP76401.1 hypothetical protein A134_08325 [Vibrio crassostreae 9CS106]OED77618.1 hypothetical protein A141_21625 [Vibrio crassostreae ZF-91]OEE87489.1 hypothetical protein A140_20930 [Vibrio crassostreae 9ZC88]OEE98163.1 hypothetical protein A138_17865 [Vibrio crassostreae 9ZC77]OEF02661.1 hypothetical protein A136_08585 [Vibrio crassostreae 9ZC13]
MPNLKLRSLSAIFFFAVTLPIVVLADEGQDVEEVAKELANPNTTLGSMSFNLDWTNYQGDLNSANSQNGYRLSFQPVLPVPIAERTNLFIRPNIPLIFDQPYYKGDRFENSDAGLGDIGFDVAVGHTFESGMIVVGGIVGTLPTATSDELGNDQFLLGPEFALAYVQSWGVIGALITHQWNAGGSNDADASITGGQYFYTANLDDGWQIQAQPTWSYNHEASSGNKLSFPIGIGFAKTTLIGGKPIKFGLQYWNYIESPDAFGIEHQLRLVITPVVALPW